MKNFIKFKSIIAVVILSLSATSMAFAGGILTNTNPSARFARLMALDASTNADAAYYNPAGTIKLSEGFHFSFSNQSVFQERIITSSFAPMTKAGTRDFIGKASAPLVPGLQGVYRNGKWALSGNISIAGGGGKATFDDGLPSFESQISVLVPLINKFSPGLVGAIPEASLTSKGYSLDQYMHGVNYIFGAQLGGAYEINDMFSVYAGFRLNIVHNEYEGHLTNLMLDIDAKGLDAIGFPDHSGPMNPTPIFGLVNSSDNIPAELKQKLQLPAKMAADGVHLESKQSGWGVAPIVGVHFSHVGINIGAKYEFKNSLNVENKTTVDDTGMFADGVNTAHDSPALFTIGASYDILPSLTASVGYHLFFDKDASMANDKQNHLTDNTNEYLAGIEYRINDMFLISTGGQITRFGASDAFQSDLSFSINSYSIGFGGAVNLSKNVQLNVGYFFTNYSDYTKASQDYNGTGIPGSDVYSRTNKVFAAGIDFSF
ncbi:MAG TPA: aromatic hydrocarbon degradation protein [Dysgonamonadaceae bacterium]|nr:aromatic hydrocarbon degradation protein [Dysgonamonadaceae bacterium]